MRLLAALVCALATPAFAQPAADRAPRVIKAHFTPKHQQVDRYVQVPFDVALGTTRIDIELKYDRANGENVVTIELEFGGATRTLVVRAVRTGTKLVR